MALALALSVLALLTSLEIAYTDDLTTSGRLHVLGLLGTAEQPDESRAVSDRLYTDRLAFNIHWLQGMTAQSALSRLMP